MNFLEYKQNVDDGDLVILLLGYNNMLPLKVTQGNTHQTRFGALRHDDLIGKRYGSKVQCVKGYLHVLHITPELWTMNLPHRTQILYSTDISLVVMNLDLKPGSVVVESGTGSGSLSHSLIRAVAPTGHLHTFDFHELRVQKAQEEFKEHGLDQLVTAKQADVCMDGFGLEDVADAVFLDLPKPWEALPHAAKALKKEGGRLCSFSPCIEQVQMSCKTMSQIGFKEIQTVECLLRTYDIRKAKLPMPSLGQSEELTEILGSCMSSSELECMGISSSDTPVSKELCPDKEAPKSDEEDHDNGADEDEGSCPKKLKRDDSQKQLYQYRSAIAQAKIPGHTGYLTFATMYPR